MVKRQFDYEQQFQQFQIKLNELKDLAKMTNIDLTEQIKLIEEKMNNMRQEKYQHLTAWEKILLVRSPERPTTRDYLENICDEWIELHGDRNYRDDRSVIGGIGLLEGKAVTFLGHQKGKDTNDNIVHNFGMPHPEGYRKVERLLLQAEKFNRPVITIVDTPGAYPGIGAEERGQAWAISRVLMTLSRLRVPIVAVVTGEGGSGGALALAVADRLLMLSNAVFSVVSAEACASILWKDLQRAEEMAEALKMTANDLYQLKIVDEVIEEPLGGSQADFAATAQTLKGRLLHYLKELSGKDKNLLVQERYQKIRAIGIFNDGI
ncbi:MAG: acetyl-CoA carboxylase carboxyltransferase subunit alpha [Syntrophomonadaceae bacterium]|jgi:acetyl-CoA carboxylase carboxyl transferase subunit alpha